MALLNLSRNRGTEITRQASSAAAAVVGSTLSALSVGSPGSMTRQALGAASGGSPESAPAVLETAMDVFSPYSDVTVMPRFDDVPEVDNNTLPVVRRPTVGISNGRNFWANLSITSASGGASEFPMLNSSVPNGTATKNTNFFITDIQQARTESGQPKGMLRGVSLDIVGDQPYILSISGALIDSPHFRWLDEWLENYDLYLRAGQTAARGQVARLEVDHVVYEGHILSTSVTQSKNPDWQYVQFQFSFVVSKKTVNSLPGSEHSGGTRLPELRSAWTTYRNELILAGYTFDEAAAITRQAISHEILQGPGRIENPAQLDIPVPSINVSYSEVNVANAVRTAIRTNEALGYQAYNPGRVRERVVQSYRDLLLENGAISPFGASVPLRPDDPQASVFQGMIDQYQQFNNAWVGAATAVANGESSNGQTAWRGF